MKNSSAAATAVITALVLAALLSSAPVERTIRGRASAALDAFRGSLEGRTGFSLSYRGMSPSILKSISFSDLDIRGPGSRSYLRVRRVRVYYDLGALIRGKFDRIVTGIGLEGVEARLDSADLPRIRKLFPGGEGGAFLIPELRFSGSDLALELVGFPFGPAKARLDYLILDGGKPEPSLEAAAELELALPGLPALAAEIGAIGLVSRDLGRLRGELSLSGTMGDLGLGRQRLALSWEAGESGPSFELRKVRDSAPLDATLIVDAATGRASLSCLMDGYSPGDLVSLRGKLASFDPWLATPLSGKLELSLPLARPEELSWTADLRSQAPEAAGERLADLSLRLDAGGSLARAEVREATVAGEGFSLSYRGGFGFASISLDGHLLLEAELEGLAGSIAADIGLRGSGTRYAIAIDRLEGGGAEILDTVMDLSFDRALPRAEAADFSLSFRLPQAGQPEAGAAAPAAVDPLAVEAAGAPGGAPTPRRVGATGSLNFGKSPGVEAQLALADLELAPLQPLAASFFDASAASVISSLRLDGDLVLRSDFRHLSYSSADMELGSSLLPGAHALLSFSGTERDLKLRNSTLSYGGLTALASGSASFPAEGDLGFALDLVLADLPYALSGVIRPESIEISGDYGLELSMRPRAGDFYLKARAEALPFPVPGIAGAVGIAAFDFEGNFASLREWRLELAGLSLDPAGAELGGIRLPRVELRGSFGPEGGKLASLSLQDRISRLSGAATLDWKLDGGNFLGASLELTGPGGELLRLEGRLDEATASARLDLARSPLSRFLLGSRLAGFATGRAELVGSLAEPRIELQAELVEASLDGLPLVLAGSGSYAEGRVGLREGKARWKGLEASSVTGSLDLLNRRASVAAGFRYALGDAPLTCEISANGFLRAGDGAGFRVDGNLSRVALRSIAVESWPFSLDSRPDRLLVEGGPDGEFSLSSTPSGSFTIRTVAPLPVRMQASGRILRGELDARAETISIDLPAILPLVGKLPVAIPSGFLEGQLAARGALADPELSGVLKVTSIAVDVPDYLVDRIGPLDGFLTAEGKRLILATTPTRVGAGRASASFEMGLDGWIPNTFIATLKSEASAPLHVKTQILGILVDGLGNADLRLEVNPTTLKLGGSLVLEKSALVLSPAIFGVGQAAWEIPTILLDVDMRLGFGRGVMLYFPDRRFPIVSGQVDPASSLAIRYDQAKERVSLRGDALLRGGDVFYIQRDFFLRNATIRFNESAEKFDPRVTLVAELRDSDEKGPVLVTLRADNAAIADFKPRITSDPPMTEAQIVALLGGRLVGGTDEGGNVDIRRAAIAGAEFLPQLNVTKAFESRVRETLGLDVFYLSTRILQRLLFEAAGASYVGEQGSLGSYLDETSAYAGMYLGEGIFAHAEARLADNPLEPSRPLRLDSEFGVEFDTPFGLLTWSVSPKNPQSLFIQDQSVGLTWRLSY